MPDEQPSLEEQKLALERGKFEFQIRSWEADAIKRKLEAEKAQEEVNELRKPWFKKASYLGPIATITIAVAGGLIAFGTDVFKSKVTDLIQKRDDLTKQKGQLTTQVRDLSLSIKGLTTDRDSLQGAVTELKGQLGSSKTALALQNELRQQREAEADEAQAIASFAESREALQKQLLDDLRNYVSRGTPQPGQGQNAGTPLRALSSAARLSNFNSILASMQPLLRQPLDPSVLNRKWIFQYYYPVQYVDTPRSKLREMLNLLEALGFLQVTDTAKYLGDNRRNYGLTFLEIRADFDTTLADSPFLKQGAPRSEDDYDRAGARALDLLNRSDDLQAYRGRILLDTKLWREMRELGQPSFPSLFPSLNQNQVAVITADYTTVVRWTALMRRVGTEIRDLVEASRNHQSGEVLKHQSILRKRLLEISDPKQLEWASAAWGFLVLDELTNNRANVRASLHGPGDLEGAWARSRLDKAAR